MSHDFLMTVLPSRLTSAKFVLAHWEKQVAVTRAAEAPQQDMAHMAGCRIPRFYPVNEQLDPENYQFLEETNLSTPIWQGLCSFTAGYMISLVGTAVIEAPWHTMAIGQAGGKSSWERCIRNISVVSHFLASLRSHEMMICHKKSHQTPQTLMVKNLHVPSNIR